MPRGIREGSVARKAELRLDEHGPQRVDARLLRAGNERLQFRADNRDHVALDEAGFEHDLAAVVGGVDHDDDGAAGGSAGKCGDAALVIGGSVVTSASAEKETEVWDLLQDPEQGDGLAMSGTRFSKWKGPIFSGERPRPVTQRGASGRS